MAKSPFVFGQVTDLAPKQSVSVTDAEECNPIYSTRDMQLPMLFGLSLLLAELGCACVVEKTDYLFGASLYTLYVKRPRMG